MGSLCGPHVAAIRPIGNKTDMCLCYTSKITPDDTLAAPPTVVIYQKAMYSSIETNHRIMWLMTSTLPMVQPKSK